MTMEYFARYGLMFVFIIVFLEYLNCPGLGAAIVLPAIGIATEEVKINFWLVLIISVIAGELASYILYGLSYWFGKPMLEKLYGKFPKTRKSIDKVCFYIEKYGNKGILIIRLIPVGRTLIPFVAGIFKMNFGKFSIYSAIGTTIWNGVFIYAGYAFGSWFI